MTLQNKERKEHDVLLTNVHVGDTNVSFFQNTFNATCNNNMYDIF